MFQRFAAMPTQPVLSALEHFAQGLNRQMPEQQSPHSGNEQACQIQYCPTGRYQPCAPYLGICGVDIRGRHRQYSCVGLDPRQLQLAEPGEQLTA
ncbi:hypothetical protein D3C77_513070 [compost metagenome]